MQATELVTRLGDWSVGGGPLYRKLADALRRGCDEGWLPVSTRLPSERSLARCLALSRATVVAAYDELRGAGLASSRRGSGTVISAGGSKVPSDGYVAGGQGNAIFRRLVEGPREGELISLVCATPTAHPGVPELLREVAAEIDWVTSDIGYHPRGLLELRRGIAAHLTEQGLATGPEQVLVTTGAHQALMLAAQVYLRPGQTVLVEKPSFAGCLDVFRAAGARLVGIPTDEEGMRVEDLRGALAEHRAALVYVMPTYHNPAGLLMSAQRRRRIARLARERGVPVIEDNALAGAGLGVSPPEPLAAFAERGDVLTVGSLSKSVWGGLRIGWVRGQTESIQRLARRKALNDLGSPVIDQAVAARVLPRYGEIAAARAAELRERLTLVESLLAQQLPQWRWRTPDGGPSLWIDIGGVDAGRLAQAALRHGVEIVPGSAMDPGGEHDTYFRLPFTFPPEVLRELVPRLAGAWEDARSHVATSYRGDRPVV